MPCCPRPHARHIVAKHRCRMQPATYECDWNRRERWVNVVTSAPYVAVGANMLRCGADPTSQSSDTARRRSLPSPPCTGPGRWGAAAALARVYAGPSLARSTCLPHAERPIRSCPRASQLVNRVPCVQAEQGRLAAGVRAVANGGGRGRRDVPRVHRPHARLVPARRLLDHCARRSHHESCTCVAPPPSCTLRYSA